MTAPIWYLLGLSALWMVQFLLFRPKVRHTPVKTAPRARWGLVLQILGYWAIFLPARTHWREAIPIWRLGAGIAAGLAGIWLVSAGIRHLGKQWRVNAALIADHELVTSGPYQTVRHPIYASMLTMFLMAILLLGRLPWWPIGLVLFVAGIEIRVHTEDGLLRERFGERFEEWKKAVPAYVPRLH